jgi:pimeloyl-ACP methyl ester carboxylesterase
MDRQRFPASGGVTLTADVGGPPGAVPVILTHGGGQTRGAWRRAAALLADHGYWVISLDLRGHGESDWAPDADYSLGANVADLKAVCATLSSPPALVGASLGGVTALLAVGAGLQARALVLVDIVPQINPEGAGKIGAFMRANPEGFANLDEAADAVAAYNPHRPRPSDPSGLMRNLREGPGGRLFWHWDPKFMSAPNGPGGPDMADRMTAAARTVTIPTLLIRGAQSDVVDLEGVANFRSLIPAAEYVDVKGAGHMVAGDKNDAFNAAIVEFLDRTTAPRASR